MKEGTDYTVRYKNNTGIGTATAIIKEKGLYSGTIKKNFQIVLKKTTVSSIKAKKKGFTVNWKCQPTGTTFYVRVRTYKKLDGVCYYSAWSPAKSVTTK